MLHIALIFLGGGAGAVSRHLVNGVALRAVGPNFPAGTLAVNVIGSLLMGLFIGWIVKSGASTETRLLVATGFLGGFTTFSAFSLDVANLWERGAGGVALVYVVASVILSVAAVFAGLAIARAVGS
ncbi:MAG: fluoride efflux transporter CrcB [Pseudomonadota bacterium]